MNKVTSTGTMSRSEYNKRPGTSGIRGHLYETKLISLILFRAIQDDSIEDFHLATNVDQIGAFDDICFKAKLKGFERPLTVFIQAKHKEDNEQKQKIYMGKYFESYLNIRHKYKPNNKEVLFNGNFDETECLFVIYTNAKDDFETYMVESSFANNLFDLIGTGGTAKQPFKNKEDVECLCKIVMKEDIISLAGRIAKVMNNEDNFQMLLNDERVLRYHVILAQKVINVSEIQSKTHRIASFRQDFFDTEEEFLILLKDTLYIEILKNRKIGDTDIKTLLTNFLEEPSDVKIFSELIGTVLRYNIGQLEFLNKNLTKDYKPKLDKVTVSQATVNQAIEIAAKDILTRRKFKVPTWFGNKDITIKGSDVKVDRRINYLVSTFFDLLEKTKSSNNYIITIDETLENGFLELNGGIAGAVGNILVPEENNKLLKFTDNSEFLGDLATRLFEKLSSGIYNLQEYKFSVKVKKFPKHSWDHSEYYEENLAKDFINKLLLYSNQADEKKVEEILSEEIDDIQYDHLNNYQIRTDAIFVKYHYEIQKWWMNLKKHHI